MLGQFKHYSNVTMVLLFLYLLIDPGGKLGWKAPVLIMLVFFLLYKNLSFRAQIVRSILSLILICFSIIFVLKQEVFFEYEAYMSVISTTIGFAALFILNRSSTVVSTMVTGMKIFLIINLCFLIIGFYFVDFAIVLNILLKDYQMLSLESRNHFITEYSFYHNSIYPTIMILPLLIREIKIFGALNTRGVISVLCIGSLLLTQSRTVLLAFGIFLILCLPRFTLFLMPLVILSVFLSGIITLDDSSNMKLSYLSTFWSQFTNWRTVLLGTGPIAIDWGAQAGTYAFIELTYFELLRYFGVIGVVILFLILAIYYIKYLRMNLSRQQFHGIIMFLGILSVNPYLWGITGLPMLAIYSSIRYHDS